MLRVLKILIFLFIGLLIGIGTGGKAYAGADVSVSGGNWAIGTVQGEEVTTSGAVGRSADKWTVTGSSDGTEDVYIKVTGTNWDPAAASGTNQFILKHDVSGSWGSAITNSGNGILLKGSLEVSGTQDFDLQFTAPSSGNEGVEQTLTVTLAATNYVASSWSCGLGLAVDHTYAVGGPAPVTKSVTYGTVTSLLSGASKCWITQNLGATTNAASATESTEPNAGWYWQFNRKQGYKHDGTTLTPAWTITGINEASDWAAANDPCTIELGAGWRLPTYTEWFNADANVDGAWGDYNDTYASALKLHAAGYLLSSSGALMLRGAYGYYWSSTQGSDINGWNLYISLHSSAMGSYSKAYGWSVRCLKD